MDPVGVHSLSPAAAQGRQDTSSEHANGLLFTGWGADTQSPEGQTRTAGRVPFMVPFTFAFKLELIGES